MWRRIGVFGVTVLTAVMASCSSATDMATVDGVGISEEEVLAMRRVPVEGPTAPAAPIRQDLTTLIVEQAVASAAEEQFGVSFTDEEVAARLTDPPERYVPLFEQLAADANLGEGFSRVNARFTLVRDEVIPLLLLDSGSSPETLVDQSPEQVLRACVKHILVGTEEEAVDVLARLDAGEDFADVASEVSLDTQSPGGVLGADQGCLVHHGGMGGEFLAAVMEAPIGELTGPITTPFGFHVLQVDERVLPTAEQVAADPMAYLDPNVGTDLLGAWFQAAVTDADVHVRSSVGVWDPETATVVAAS